MKVTWVLKSQGTKKPKEDVHSRAKAQSSQEEIILSRIRDSKLLSKSIWVGTQEPRHKKQKYVVVY